MHRCPQKIKITDIMYMLKRMAIRENRQRSKNAAALSRAFFDIVNKKGRNHETLLMAKVVLGTNPLGGISLAPIGLGLITHSRLPIFGKKIRDIDGLRKIIAKAQELGGE
jgi:heterodisulfide reductase subunit C